MNGVVFTAGQITVEEFNQKYMAARKVCMPFSLIICYCSCSGVSNSILMALMVFFQSRLFEIEVNVKCDYNLYLLPVQLCANLTVFDKSQQNLARLPAIARLWFSSTCRLHLCAGTCEYGFTFHRVTED